MAGTPLFIVCSTRQAGTTAGGWPYCRGHLWGLLLSASVCTVHWSMTPLVALITTKEKKTLKLQLFSWAAARVRERADDGTLVWWRCPYGDARVWRSRHVAATVLYCGFWRSSSSWRTGTGRQSRAREQLWGDNILYAAGCRAASSELKLECSSGLCGLFRLLFYIHFSFRS